MGTAQTRAHDVSLHVATNEAGNTLAVPDVSVVIASVNGASFLDACLGALTKQQGSVRGEIVVADRVGGEVRELICQKYPHVNLLSFDKQLSIPELRSIGIARSHGRLVAVTEDHCVPAPNWFERIVAAHRADHIAVGGTVENGATERLVDWAVFLCEYHRHTGPIAEGVSRDLPGMNVAYKRAAFDHLQDLLANGSWETALHARLREKGLTLYFDPSVQVLHRKSFTIGGFLSERYNYARAFAGKRVEGAAPSRRLAYGIGALALPPLLLTRIASHLFRRRCYRLRFVETLPLLILFVGGWSIGECVGYLRGPGNSLAKVK